MSLPGALIESSTSALHETSCPAPFQGLSTGWDLSSQDLFSCDLSLPLRFVLPGPCPSQDFWNLSLRNLSILGLVHPGTCPQDLSPGLVPAVPFGPCPRDMSPGLVPAVPFGPCPRDLSPGFVPGTCPGCPFRALFPGFVPGTCPGCPFRALSPGLVPGTCPGCPFRALSAGLVPGTCPGCPFRALSPGFLPGTCPGCPFQDLSPGLVLAVPFGPCPVPGICPRDLSQLSLSSLVPGTCPQDLSWAVPFWPCPCTRICPPNNMLWTCQTGTYPSQISGTCVPPGTFL